MWAYGRHLVAAGVFGTPPAVDAAARNASRSERETRRVPSGLAPLTDALSAAMPATNDWPIVEASSSPSLAGGLWRPTNPPGRLRALAAVRASYAVSLIDCSRAENR